MKIALITGGNGKLGKSYIKTLTNNGYFVYSIDIRHSKNKVENVKKIIVDITDEKEIGEFFKNIKYIDLLINNAGIGVFTPTQKRSIDEFRKVLNVNLVGTFIMSQFALKKMVKQKKGKIINIGSVYGIKSSDPRIYGNSGRNNSEVYSASKAGVIMLTKYLASHYARYNIQINSISPGGILNNQDKKFQINYSNKTPAGRMASTYDMQSVLEMLISKKSDYINGSNIVIDGGFTSW